MVTLLLAYSFPFVFLQAVGNEIDAILEPLLSRAVIKRGSACIFIHTRKICNKLWATIAVSKRGLRWSKLTKMLKRSTKYLMYRVQVVTSVAGRAAPLQFAVSTLVGKRTNPKYPASPRKVVVNHVYGMVSILISTPSAMSTDDSAGSHCGE